jgi:hypothetical protein
MDDTKVQGVTSKVLPGKLEAAAHRQMARARGVAAEDQELRREDLPWKKSVMRTLRRRRSKKPGLDRFPRVFQRMQT